MPLPPPDERVSAAGPLNEFRVYRAENAATDCEYGYLAPSVDHAVLLCLGSSSLCIELDPPRETTIWLRDDYVPTEEAIVFDLAGLLYLFDLTYAGGLEFLLADFDEQLKLSSLCLTLRAQKFAEDGPEYLVRPDGTFVRLYRETDERCPVSPAEEALLRACAALFNDIALEKPHLISALPPPRFRPFSQQAKPPLSM